MASFYLSAFADEAADSLTDQIRALVDNGIHYLEPRNIDGRGILTLTDEELDAMKAELDAAGITVGSIGSPIGKYPIDAPMEPHMKDLARACEVAHRLGTTRIRMFSFFTEGHEDIAPLRGEVMRRLSEMAAYAKGVGITLCHENESGIYGCHPAEVADILDTVTDLDGIFDPANYIVNGASIPAGIDATLKRLSYLHIKDAIYNDEGKHIIVPAGEGDGDIAELLRRVDAHTDAPVMLTLEPHLHIFQAYAAIDGHGLSGTHTFTSAREAFDFAATSLKGILTSLGFTEDHGIWKK